MDFKSSIKRVDTDIVFIGDYLEIYIPTDFFQIDVHLAEDMGTYISSIGLLYCRVFDKDDKPGKLEILNLPTTITFYITDSETRKINLDGEEESYKVCKYFKGSKIMPAEIIQQSTAVELFFNLVLRGKVPKNIPYDRVLEVWMKNLRMNGANLGVPTSVLEIILREVYRDRKTSEPFARAYGKNPNIDLKSCITANMRTICAMNSTYAALTFEDFVGMVTTSLNRTAEGKSENISPLERVIKM